MNCELIQNHTFWLRWVGETKVGHDLKAKCKIPLRIIEQIFSIGRKQNVSNHCSNFTLSQV